MLYRKTSTRGCDLFSRLVCDFSKRVGKERIERQGDTCIRASLLESLGFKALNKFNVKLTFEKLELEFIKLSYPLKLEF